MPRQTEPNANNALGNLLYGMMPGRQVRSENTQAIVGHPGLRPDIIVTSLGRSPVVIEAEYVPARTVEEEARSRLGLEVAVDGRVIEAAIALRYPDAIGDASDLRAALESARLEYCVFTEGGGDPERFPASGWLEGGVEDLADMVRLVCVPQRAVGKAADTLEKGIEGAAKLLDETSKLRPGITTGIARLLGMVDVPQTRRMACAIIANALVFHEHIAGMHTADRLRWPWCAETAWTTHRARCWLPGTTSWRSTTGPSSPSPKTSWRNWTPADAAIILRRLRNTAQSVKAAGVDNAHDLTGRIFQRLIADRKYLATFYTLPASSALLARLAVAKMEGVDWSDPDAIGKLRIGDFACGTGALLSAVYDEIAARHERTGGNPADLHKAMMEDVLYGCDVMPSAIHITGSTLSGVQPAVSYDDRPPLHHAIWPDEGRQRDDRLAGAAPVVRTMLTLFNTSDPAMRTGSAGEETAAQMTRRDTGRWVTTW